MTYPVHAGVLPRAPLIVFEGHFSDAEHRRLTRAAWLAETGGVVRCDAGGPSIELPCAPLWLACAVPLDNRWPQLYVVHRRGRRGVWQAGSPDALADKIVE